MKSISLWHEIVIEWAYSISQKKCMLLRTQNCLSCVYYAFFLHTIPHAFFCILFVLTDKKGLRHSLTHGMPYFKSFILLPTLQIEGYYFLSSFTERSKALPKVKSFICTRVLIEIDFNDLFQFHTVLSNSGYSGPIAQRNLNKLIVCNSHMPISTSKQQLQWCQHCGISAKEQKTC